MDGSDLDNASMLVVRLAEDRWKTYAYMISEMQDKYYLLEAEMEDGRMEERKFGWIIGWMEGRIRGRILG